MNKTIEEIKYCIEAEKRSLNRRMEKNRINYENDLNCKEYIMRTGDFGNPNIISTAVEMNALSVAYEQMKQEYGFLKYLTKIIDESDSESDN